MTRLLATLSALLGLSLVPLGLAGPTAWLSPIAHAAFSLLVVAGALSSALRGRGEEARRWGLGHLMVTLALAAAFDLSGSGWWGGPFALMLTWAWAPPVWAGVMGAVGDFRSGRLRFRKKKR